MANEPFCQLILRMKRAEQLNDQGAGMVGSKSSQLVERAHR